MRLIRGPFNARGTVEKMQMEDSERYNSLVLEISLYTKVAGISYYIGQTEKDTQEVNSTDSTPDE